MDINKFINKTIEQIAQDVSYKFGDLVMSYPAPFRVLVLAVVQSCITANLGTMPQNERELFEAAKAKMVVMTIPPELDPRKYGGVKDE